MVLPLIRKKYGSTIVYGGRQKVSHYLARSRRRGTDRCVIEVHETNVSAKRDGRWIDVSLWQLGLTSLAKDILNNLCISDSQKKDSRKKNKLLRISDPAIGAQV